MRPYWLALTGLLLGTILHAQQPPQPVQTAPPVNSTWPAAPNPARLDQLLQRWEQEMKNVHTLSAEMIRKDLDKTRGGTEEFTGTAKYMKPNLALLEMQKKGNPNVYEKYLASGTFMYAWVPSSKVVRVYELPAPKAGQVGDDNFLSFLFGMKAEEAKRRYDMKLVKEDQWYLYVEVLPRFPADKADFAKARLVLNQSNFLPRQVWFEQPNGNEITWDVPKIASGVNLPREAFQAPASLPAGWNLVRVPRSEPVGQQQPPRVIRQQNP